MDDHLNRASFILIIALCSICFSCEDTNCDFCVQICEDYGTPNYEDSFFEVTGITSIHSTCYDYLRRVSFSYDTIPFREYFPGIQHKAYAYIHRPESTTNAFETLEDGFLNCLSSPPQYKTTIESIFVITEVDINENYMKNDTINNIVNVITSGACTADVNFMPLNKYMGNGPVSIENLTIQLSLGEKPAALDTFSFKTYVLHSNGLDFTDSSKPVILE